MFFFLLSANRWCRQQEMHMQYVSWHCNFFQLFPLSSWLIYGGGENINKYERGGEREKGFHRFQPHQEHCHQDRQETAAACHVFLALAKGNVRQTCRHCHPLSFFAPFQLIETVQIPIFFQMVQKNSHTVYLTFIGSSVNLLVRRFCLASSEKCDLPVSAFFTAIGREFHIFCDCDQTC